MIAARHLAVLAVLTLVAVVTLAGAARAEVYRYPIAWPKAGGRRRFAVPTGRGSGQRYRRFASPHNTGYDTPLSETPWQTYSAVPDEPIVLHAPAEDPTADEDHFLVLVSSVPLIL